MNGGKISGFFGSMFGELFLDKDCANILQDPNADPMDKDICETFKEFSAGFPSIDSIVDREPGDSDPDREGKPDAQSLRDSIFNKQNSPKQPGRSYSPHQPKGDEDLDSRLAEGADPNTLLDPAPSHPTSEGFSLYTKITVTRRSDGTVEERRTHRDSLGNEETTIITDKEKPSGRPDIKSGLSDWVWPKQ